MNNITFIDRRFAGWQSLATALAFASVVACNDNSTGPTGAPAASNGAGGAASNGGSASSFSGTGTTPNAGAGQPNPSQPDPSQPHPSEPDPSQPDPGTAPEVGVGALIWEEKFDTLDPKLWSVDVGDGCNIGLCGWGNQELQWYAESNVSIADIPGEPGNKALKLQARREDVGGRTFTAGKLNTEHKLAIKYGLIELRIRVPNVETGLWPAAWMLGTSTLTWPAKGEIDMMEMGHDAAERVRQGEAAAHGNGYVGSNLIFYAAAACGDANPTCAASTAWDVNADKPYVAATPMNDRFVIYRTYWTDSQIRFTVTDEGKEHDLYEAPFSISAEAAELQQPFYLLMNLAVGGAFTGLLQNSDIAAPMPADMYVDYVRVYKLDGQGQVYLGNVMPPESGSFGVFTDTTATKGALETGVDSQVDLWDPFSAAGKDPPFEGSSVISYDYAPGSWFGGGILSRQPRDLNAFGNGHLSFRIKIPAGVGFRIGLTDTYGNAGWVTFPANASKYGLARDGQWGQAKIPVSELQGGLVALQSLSYVFAYSQDPAALPTTAFSYSIDDVYWTAD